MNEAALDIGVRYLFEPLLSILLEIAKGDIYRSESILNTGEQQMTFLGLCSFTFLPAKQEGCNFSASPSMGVIFWLFCLPENS